MSSGGNNFNYDNTTAKYERLGCSSQSVMFLWLLFRYYLYLSMSAVTSMYVPSLNDSPVYLLSLTGDQITTIKSRDLQVVVVRWHNYKL